MALTDRLVRHAAPECLAGDCAWETGLLVDVGSTFTKAAVVDPAGYVTSSAHARTTIETDVRVGLAAAVGSLSLPPPFDWALVCSSAAGGLRMASVGLTQNLSGQAAVFAALGAGAKVVATECGYLDDDAVRRIADAVPDLILLSGGLDGGNEQALVHNAQALSSLDGVSGYVVAGNAAAAERAAAILKAASVRGEPGRSVMVVPNVFPAPGSIEVSATREAVRELFLRHITRAKGLDALMSELRSDCEPTPMAVSRSLPTGRSTVDAPVVLVDVGGATTDVHSSGGRQYARTNTGVPAPIVQRSVEGDLGVRWGAPGIVDTMNQQRRRIAEAALGIDLRAEAERLRSDPGKLATTELARAVDETLAETAIAVAMDRHCGRIVVRHQPWGDRYRAKGKDLRRCRLLLATGGVLTHSPGAAALVRRAVAQVEDRLGPRGPEVVVDDHYQLYATGLVARRDEHLARLMRSRFTDSPRASRT